MQENLAELTLNQSTKWLKQNKKLFLNRSERQSIVWLLNCMIVFLLSSLFKKKKIETEVV